jgi:hypothetical protein
MGTVMTGIAKNAAWQKAVLGDLWLRIYYECTHHLNEGG